MHKLVLSIILTIVCAFIGFFGFDSIYHEEYLFGVLAHFAGAGVGLLLMRTSMGRVRGSTLPILINFCVPIVGGLGVGILGLSGVNKGREGLAEEYALHIDPEEYRELFTRVSEGFNPNPADLYSFSDILNADVPIVQKRIAIEGLAQMENPQTVAVLRETLQMDSVEVRFFAASVLGKMEMRLEQKILELRDEDRGGVQVPVITELAQTYFDFVFFSLVEGARRDEYLALSLGYALDALTIEPSSTMLALVGRILLAKGQYESAIRVFNLYIKESPKDVKGWLWRAEAYLHNNDYIKASEDARLALDIGGVPKPLESAATFWAEGVNNERAV